MTVKSIALVKMPTVEKYRAGHFPLIEKGQALSSLHFPTLYLKIFYQNEIFRSQQFSLSNL